MGFPYSEIGNSLKAQKTFNKVRRRSVERNPYKSFKSLIRFALLLKNVFRIRLMLQSYKVTKLQNKATILKHY